MFKSNRKHPPYIIMGMKCMSEYWAQACVSGAGGKQWPTTSR